MASSKIFTLINSSTQVATNVTYTPVFTETYLTHTASSGTYDSVGNVWTIPSMEPGEEVTLTINFSDACEVDSTVSSDVSNATPTVADIVVTIDGNSTVTGSLGGAVMCTEGAVSNYTLLSTTNATVNLDPFTGDFVVTPTDIFLTWSFTYNVTCTKDGYTFEYGPRIVNGASIAAGSFDCSLLSTCTDVWLDTQLQAGSVNIDGQQNSLVLDNLNQVQIGHLVPDVNNSYLIINNVSDASTGSASLHGGQNLALTAYERIDIGGVRINPINPESQTSPLPAGTYFFVFDEGGDLAGTSNTGYLSLVNLSSTVATNIGTLTASGGNVTGTINVAAGTFTLTDSGGGGGGSFVCSDLSTCSLTDLGTANYSDLTGVPTSLTDFTNDLSAVDITNALSYTAFSQSGGTVTGSINISTGTFTLNAPANLGDFNNDLVNADITTALSYTSFSASGGNVTGSINLTTGVFTLTAPSAGANLSDFNNDLDNSDITTSLGFTSFTASGGNVTGTINVATGTYTLTRTVTAGDLSSLSLANLGTRNYSDLVGAPTALSDFSNDLVNADITAALGYTSITSSGGNVSGSINMTAGSFTASYAKNIATLSANSFTITDTTEYVVYTGSSQSISITLDESVLTSPKVIWFVGFPTSSGSGHVLTFTTGGATIDTELGYGILSGGDTILTTTTTGNYSGQFIWDGTNWHVIRYTNA